MLNINLRLETLPLWKLNILVTAAVCYFRFSWRRFGRQRRRSDGSTRKTWTSAPTVRCPSPSLRGRYVHPATLIVLQRTVLEDNFFYLLRKRLFLAASSTSWLKRLWRITNFIKYKRLCSYFPFSCECFVCSITAGTVVKCFAPTVWARTWTAAPTCVRLKCATCATPSSCRTRRPTSAPSLPRRPTNNQDAHLIQFYTCDQTFHTHHSLVVLVL